MESTEPRDGIEQVDQAMLKMDQMPQQNAASVEQAAAAEAVRDSASDRKPLP